jgi:hypothetical protein
MLKAVAGWLAKLSTPGRWTPPPPSDTGPMAEMRRYIDSLVAAGFTPEGEIASAAVYYMEGEADPALLTREAGRMTREALGAHRAAQAGWPEVTDCDRLDAAFATLEASGVIVRQDWTCCGTCGAAEIWDEIETAERQGRTVRGYAFYHQQDTERATEGDGLYLNYGAREDSDAAAVAIGHEIVAALEAKGLTTQWEGVISKRIGVGLDWKRRAGPVGVAI